MRPCRCPRHNRINSQRQADMGPRAIDLPLLTITVLEGTAEKSVTLKSNRTKYSLVFILASYLSINHLSWTQRDPKHPSPEPA